MDSFLFSLFSFLFLLPYIHHKLHILYNPNILLTTDNKIPPAITLPS